ncbi:MAG: hypothetical protein ACREPF_03655, partial [Rhodanobacteraceae bacterium]
RSAMVMSSRGSFGNASFPYLMGPNYELVIPGCPRFLRAEPGIPLFAQQVVPKLYSGFRR